MPAISLNFLERHDLYKEEKPYVLTFKPPDGFPSTNVKLDLHEDVEVYDIRGRENEFSIDQNGFALMKLNSQLSYKDFGEDEIVSKIYLKEVADALIKRLGASQVQIFEHVVSSLYYKSLDTSNSTRFEGAMKSSLYLPANRTSTISLHRLPI